MNLLKPNSVFSGVRIGCITYSYRGEVESAEDTLRALIEGGLSEVELMGGPIQSFAGISGRDAAARLRPSPPTRNVSPIGKMRRTAQDVQRCGGQYPHSQNGVRPVGRGDRFQFSGGESAWLRRDHHGAIGATCETTRSFRRQTQDLGRVPQPHRQLPCDGQRGPHLSYGQYIGFNFDVGHYFAGTKGQSRSRSWKNITTASSVCI